MAQYTFPKDLADSAIVAEVLEAAFPVDVIILTDDNENPSLKGLPGTWEAV